MREIIMRHFISSSSLIIFHDVFLKDEVTAIV